MTHEPSRLRTSVLFLLAYVASVGAIMFASTAFLELGDPKWGASGWQYYWPLWALVYSPAVVVVILQSLRLPTGQLFRRFLAPMLALLVALVSLSFALDVSWLYLVPELIAVAGVSEALIRLRAPAV